MRLSRPNYWYLHLLRHHCMLQGAPLFIFLTHLSPLRSFRVLAPSRRDCFEWFWSINWPTRPQQSSWDTLWWLADRRLVKLVAQVHFCTHPASCVPLSQAQWHCGPNYLPAYSTSFLWSAGWTLWSIGQVQPNFLDSPDLSIHIDHHTQS